VPREWSLGSLRVTLGTGTTPAAIKTFCECLPGCVEKTRELVRA
jgi:cysteine sulfinate desulfinase/cysteine desulfurase-like protein